MSWGRDDGLRWPPPLPANNGLAAGPGLADRPRPLVGPLQAASVSMSLMNLMGGQGPACPGWPTLPFVPAAPHTRLPTHPPQAAKLVRWSMATRGQT